MSTTNNRERVHLVDGKKVAIIKSNEHTYNVRFVKSGKFMEIHKRYVKTWYPDNSKKKTVPKTKKNSQTKLDLK